MTAASDPGSASDTHPFAIVDVFAERPLEGNPLAVVTSAEDLTEAQMAAIAVEFNLSETTFVSRPTLAGATFRLRSFTPGGDEVTGAGHNALGAWWWLARTGAASGPHAAQELGGRVLPVHIDADDAGVSIALDQGPVDLSEARVDEHALREALGGGAPGALDGRVPLVVGSVGSPHLLVALETAHDVDAVEPDGPALARVLSGTRAQGCYVFSVAGEDGPHDAYCRFFNPTVGIAEDPATGSAAGPLAAHLHRLGLANGDVRVLQGRRMGRPSLVRIAVEPSGTTLSGRCAFSATGRLHL